MLVAVGVLGFDAQSWALYGTICKLSAVQLSSSSIAVCSHLALSTLLLYDMSSAFSAAPMAVSDVVTWFCLSTAPEAWQVELGAALGTAPKVIQLSELLTSKVEVTTAKLVLHATEVQYLHAEQAGKPIWQYLLEAGTTLWSYAETAFASMPQLIPLSTWLAGPAPAEAPVEKVNALEELRYKVVLVTGSAGSIGSELCHQIAAAGAATLILLDVAESPLVELARKLEVKYPRVQIVPRLQDICQSRRMSRLFAKYKPQLVFHAAAYKHVPLLQQFVWSAINTNAWGTYVVAKLAQRYKAERFVLLSTDKAVDPQCLMGATKWLAEEWMAMWSAQSKHTQFITIRFGNVIGSRGSVLPQWAAQLRQGQPLTVTSEAMERFFISTPDACRRLLATAMAGSSGGRYGFWMPVYNIQHLARLFLHSVGAPNYPIAHTGIRPGERLQEKLIGESETLGDDLVPEVFSIRYQPQDAASLEDFTISLFEAMRFYMDERMWRLMKGLCPALAPITAVQQQAY